ncbi:MAG: magnesium transporter CorA family protein [Acidobacteriota bacterium]
MHSIFVHRDGVTRQVDAVDPAWLTPQATEIVWANIDGPVEADRQLLQGVFHFHELAVEDALADLHYPKIESYGHFLYAILHGIATEREKGGFCTRDVDFFLGRNFLVTVHTQTSPAIDAELAVVVRHPNVLGEGSVALLHRIADRMVDGYLPCIDALEQRLDELEQVVFEDPRANPLQQILRLKADVASLRRVALPQRDAVGRLSRREFPEIPEVMAYRFRDVYDHLVRIADEATFFQDRITGLVDAYLSTQSNRMNQVMKVLTLIATIFMPLTVLTGMWGMNVKIPHFPGSEAAQFWWVTGLMAALTTVMLWWFRRMRWL